MEGEGEASADIGGAELIKIARRPTKVAKYRLKHFEFIFFWKGEGQQFDREKANLCLASLDASPGWCSGQSRALVHQRLGLDLVVLQLSGRGLLIPTLRNKSWNLRQDMYPTH